jgi:hypothetical protein
VYLADWADESKLCMPACLRLWRHIRFSCWCCRTSSDSDVGARFSANCGVCVCVGGRAFTSQHNTTQRLHCSKLQSRPMSRPATRQNTHGASRPRGAWPTGWRSAACAMIVIAAGCCSSPLCQLRSCYNSLCCRSSCSICTLQGSLEGASLFTPCALTRVHEGLALAPPNALLCSLSSLHFIGPMLPCDM